MQAKIPLKSLAPYIAAIFIFIVVTFFMFKPLFEGKSIKQQDIKQSRGMSKEIVDFRHDTGKEPLWTNSMFSGMPAYQISMKSKNNLLMGIHHALSLGFIPGPARFFFISLISFFVLMLAFKLNPWISLVGALAFALSSYMIINIEAGHNTKAAAIAYMPLVLAGFVTAFRRNRWIGAALAGLGMALQLASNHPQIFYYTMIIILIYGIAEIIQVFREKRWLDFSKSTGLLAFALLLAVGSNITRLWTTYEYSKESIRGGTDLQHPDKINTGGLDKDYALAWSYGKAETLTLLIPNFVGGSSMVPLYDKGSKTLDYLQQSNFGKLQKDNPKAAQAVLQTLGAYWGPQPFTSGPVYFGALIIFLFVFALFALHDNTLKWWVLAAVLLSIMLSWGNHFMGFTNLFFNHFPLYNKFRTVSMILVIAQLLMPMLAIIGLAKLLQGELDKQKAFKALKISVISVAAVLLILSLFPAIAGLSASHDDTIYSALPNQADQLLNAVHADRAHLLRADAFRSLIIILIGAAFIFLFIKEKIKPLIVIAAIGALILFDLWGVDGRYLNKDSYEKDFIQKALAPSQASLAILQNGYNTHPELTQVFNDAVKSRQEALRKKYPSRYKRMAPKLNAQELTNLKFKVLNQHTDYRVFNLSVSPFNDATTSYYHKSIGGYHGAKMQRYQELYNKWMQPVLSQLGQGGGGIELLMNANFLNMLNTKFVIFSNTADGVLPMQNAQGNAWFVQEAAIAQSADNALDTIGLLNLNYMAVVEKPFASYLDGFIPGKDSSSTITLSDYAPNQLVYQTHTSKEQLAVFSEIYYDGGHKGWQAYIDGEAVKHIRADYILRCMKIPAGDHEVVFKFEPRAYYSGEKIALASSVLLLLFFFGIMGWQVKKQFAGSDVSSDE